jgi:ribosome assembly protein RRB1
VEQKFGLADLPPQLLFLHQGQQEVTEAMWHPLLPSTAISAGSQGFHIWKAFNL